MSLMNSINCSNQSYILFTSFFFLLKKNSIVWGLFTGDIDISLDFDLKVHLKQM